MARSDTKTLLLEVGKRIFSERGYTNSGIELILQEAHVPKGSFYNYFQSKEDFGIRVIERFSEEQALVLEQAFSDRTLSPMTRFRRYFEAKIADFEGFGCRGGCLIGRLSQEMSDQSETFRARLEEVFEAWVDRYVAIFEEAKEAGELPSDLDLRTLAQYWLVGWQGAVLCAKTTQQSSLMRLVLTTFLSQFFDCRRPVLEKSFR